MAALSTKAQGNHLVVVRSLSLSMAEADRSLRTELLSIQDELSNHNTHFTRRNLFRLRVYQALEDPDAVLFRDADGHPLDQDAAVEAAMIRLRHNNADMLSLLESTLVFLNSARLCLNYAPV